MKKYILFLLLFAQGIFAQVEFKAVPSKTTLGVNERFRIDFTMNEDGDNFVPPSFQGFNAMGPSQMISNSWVNGKRTFSKTYSYTLSPTARGTFTIGQASIEIGGKTYKTSPIKITVTAAVKEAEDPNNPVNKAGEGVHLVAEVSKINPYINEPVTVVYKLYVSHNSSVRNWREMDMPKFNDFWSQNIDIKDLVIERGTFKGEDYRYVVLRRTVLYPQKDGRLEIEPLSLNVTLEVPTGRRDFFGGLIFTQASKVVSAEKKYINVKPFPENGKPADFTGAVGSFDFTVTPSKTTLSHGESLQLQVAVSGKGNLKLFNLPKPVVPAALEMYDPEYKENINIPLSGMQGKKSDNYTIIPQFKGKYTIKPLRFSYFDLASSSYKTITSEEIVIDVLDGPGLTSGSGAAPSIDTQKQGVNPVSQFKFINRDTILQPVEREDFLGSVLFYVLLFLPVLAIPLLMLAKKKKDAFDSDVAGIRTRQNKRLAKKYFSETKKQLGNKEAFYIALEKALHNFLKAKLHIETSEMTKENIRQLLIVKKADQDTVNDFIGLMDSCEFARYAPSSTVAMQKDYDASVTVISALEKQI